MLPRSALRERTEAVEEILSNLAPRLSQLRDLLKRLPDLARGLCRIQYGKCTPQELAVLLRAFRRVATSFPPGQTQSQAVPIKARLLVGVMDALPRLLGPVCELCDAVRMEEAAAGREATMWVDPKKFPELEETSTVSRCASPWGWETANPGFSGYRSRRQSS